MDPPLPGESTPQADLENMREDEMKHKDNFHRLF